ncbi:MAG: DNA polymerase I, partial [Clostridia bacterium]|nr:DNA polymerase I [Clostridia bacterium]
MKLLAIDGNSIINRAFYGIKLLSTKDGRYTNAIYGFINILFRMLDDEKPDGVAVAFDIKKPTFRHVKYAEYKAGRHAMPDELRDQFPLLKEWLCLAGYTCIECEGFEADDILGTLAAAAVKSGNECVIATGDRDSLQLVSEHTRVLLASTRMGKTEVINYTPDAVFERYGVTPPEMIELKALMGDSSDNIPGVAGVGEKTASDLIGRYHSIDYIYDNLETLEIKDGVRNKLRDGKDSAYLSRWLGTICCDAPINTDFDALRTRDADTTNLRAFMTELELFKLLERMNLKPQAAVVEKEKKCYRAKAFDTLPDKADIYIDQNGAAAVYGDSVSELNSEQLKALLINEDTKKRVYDYKRICKQFPDTKGVCFDAMLAGYLCNPSSNDYSLTRLAAEYSKEGAEICGEVSDVAQNAVLLSVTSNALEAALIKSDELKLLTDIELPLARVLAEMEADGFLVDTEGLRAQGEELADRIEEIQSEIYTMAGIEFNINSPKQLGEVLFEKLGLPAKKKTKSGYSTNA